MKKKKNIWLVVLLAFHMFAFPFTIKSQSWLVGPVDPSIGSSANYTSHNHYQVFDVLNSNGVYLDSITIYPATAATSFTIVVQNSLQAVIASYTGTSTTGGNLADRFKTNLFVPMGTGYRLGLTTGSVGVLRNSTGASYPYAIPSVLSFTGNTFNATYWYFFYNIRVKLPAVQTDAGISAIAAPGDSVCAGTQPVQVTLKNFGPNDLSSATIHWAVNNVAQAPFSWTGTIPVNGTSNITVGNFAFATGTTYDIKAYTHMPNSQSDTVNANDTLMKPGIFVKTAPTATFVASTANLCAGDTLTLSGAMTGTPPWTLVVSNGTIQQTFANITAATYAVPLVPTLTATYTLVSVSDATGCLTLPGTTQTVTVNPAPPATITPQGSPAACYGDSVSMMASVGLNFAYAWFKDGVQIPGAPLYVFHAKEGGNYTVQVTSPIGCKNTSAPLTITIHPLPVVNLGSDTTLQPGQTLPLNVGTSFTSYLWSTGATIPMVTIDSSGTGIGVKTVWVVVTDNNGCKGSDTLKINFTNNPGIGEPTGDQQVRICPNPTNGITEIRFNTALQSPVKCEIYSQDGRMVFEVNGEPGNIQLRLDLQHLANGQYLLKLTSGTWSSTQKLLIIRE